MADVRVPFKAKVVDVLVRPGDKVRKDQVLFRIEVMKMELPVSAPCDGVVKQVCCSRGDEVEGDSVIAVIEQ